MASSWEWLEGSIVKGWKGMFDFAEGVIRWEDRVIAYAFLVTDRHRPSWALRDTAGCRRAHLCGRRGWGATLPAHVG